MGHGSAVKECWTSMNTHVKVGSCGAPSIITALGGADRIPVDFWLVYLKLYTPDSVRDCVSKNKVERDRGRHSVCTSASIWVCIDQVCGHMHLPHPNQLESYLGRSLTFTHTYILAHICMNMQHTTEHTIIYCQAFKKLLDRVSLCTPY